MSTTARSSPSGGRRGPGRTTVAVNLAAEIAARGSACLLIDADTYGACVAHGPRPARRGPGLAAAARAAELEHASCHPPRPHLPDGRHRLPCPDRTADIGPVERAAVGLDDPHHRPGARPRRRHHRRLRSVWTTTRNSATTRAHRDAMAPRSPHFRRGRPTRRRRRSRPVGLQRLVRALRDLGPSWRRRRESSSTGSARPRSVPRPSAGWGGTGEVRGGGGRHIVPEDRATWTGHSWPVVCSPRRRPVGRPRAAFGNRRRARSRGHTVTVHPAAAMAAQVCHDGPVVDR